MSQHTLPCTPPELPKMGVFFSYRCQVFSKNVIERSPEYFGVIQVKRSKNVFFLDYLLKQNFDKLNII